MRTTPEMTDWETLCISTGNIGQAIASQLVLLPIWIFFTENYLGMGTFTTTMIGAGWGILGIILLERVKTRARQKRRKENEKEEDNRDRDDNG